MPKSTPTLVTKLIDWSDLFLIGVGGIVCLWGVFFQFRSPPYTDLVGIALFLIGIMIYLYRIRERLDIIEPEIMLLHEFKDLAVQASTIAEIINTATSDSTPFYARAIGHVINHIAYEFVPNNTSALNRFLNNTDGAYTIPEHNVLFHFLRELTEKLESGCVWLGITKLENKEIWENPPGDFEEFRNNLRRRANSRDIQVARIYAFDSEDKYESLKPSMSIEVREKISVRYILGDKKVPDITLLWKRHGAGTTNKTIANITSSDNDNIVGEMQEAGFKILAAFVFTVTVDRINEMTIYGAENHVTATLISDFTRYWREAKMVTEYITPPPETPAANPASPKSGWWRRESA